MASASCLEANTLNRRVAGLGIFHRAVTHLTGEHIRGTHEHEQRQENTREQAEHDDREILAAIAPMPMPL